MELSSDAWTAILIPTVLGFFAFFFNRLIKQLDKLSDNVAKLNLTITRLESDIDGIDDRYTTTHELLKEHSSRIEAIQAQIYELKNKHKLHPKTMS